MQLNYGTIRWLIIHVQYILSIFSSDMTCMFYTRYKNKSIVEKISLNWGKYVLVTQFTKSCEYFLVWCSVLNTLDVIFSRVGTRIDSYLPEMLQVTVGLAGTCVTLLENRQIVAPWYVNSLKNIRGLCLNRILQVKTARENKIYILKILISFVLLYL